jgi:hypothetical protein
MKKTIDLSRDNLYYLLITVLSIGFLVCMIHITNATAINTNDLNNAFNCITQKVNKSANFTLADAFVCYDNTLPGAQKYASKPYQNPDLNHLPKIQHVSAFNNTPTKTITKDNGINPIWNPLDDVREFKLSSKTSDIFGTTSPSKTTNSSKDNFHFKNKPKDVQVINKHVPEKSHSIDVFAKSTERQQSNNAALTNPNTFHGNKSDKSVWNLSNDISETRSLSPTETSNIGSGNQINQGVTNLFNVDKKINHPTNPFTTKSNNLQTASQKTNSLFNPDPIYSSFDLPFTTFGKK